MSTGPTTPLAGFRVGGRDGKRYELIAPLGRGGFGEVWEAIDHHEDAEVAVKFLDPAVTPDRVLLEASLQRRLSAHRRIVSIRTVDIGASPTSYVVQDLHRAGSLDDVLKTRRPTVRESVRWMQDVLEALAHAHAENVLHLDVKPTNLLLGPDGHALLTDFGVAEDSIRRAGSASEMYGLTLPPEFYAMPTGIYSDIWLTGVFGWQLLVGVRPELVAAHTGGLLLPHRYSPDVPIALSRAISGALEVTPTDRPASAERMLEAVCKVPIHCGWQEVTPADIGVLRRWEADEGGDGVILEIRERRSDFLVTAKAQPGHRLHARRRSAQATRAGAEQQARAWLTQAVGGTPL